MYLQTAVAESQENHRQLSRRDLFDRIWSKPMTTNAAELGTSTFVLSALAKRLGLPLPRAGHWMKLEVGRAPPAPDYPANAELDAVVHSVAPAKSRPALSSKRPGAVERPAEAPIERSGDDGPAVVLEVASDDKETGRNETPASASPEHRKVSATRAAVKKLQGGRTAVGGRGKFRLLIGAASAGRACTFLDGFVEAIEAEDWALAATDQGYAVKVEHEVIGFMVEEKLDRVPHAVTAAELKEKSDYDRKCALADRGIGYRPWRAPQIPEHDFEPNGGLVLKFDHDYAAGGTRRTFSDGKRQHLEALVPAMIENLERWVAAVKAHRAQRERQQEIWAEQERMRRANENQARVEGYRITFLNRQVERKREINGLADLIADWEMIDEVDPGFAQLLDFARLYRRWLEAKISPSAIAERIATLKLMDDDVYIYDAKRLD
jgi:hypothetical protein